MTNRDKKSTGALISRRGMLKAGAAAGALATFSIVPRHVLGQGQTPPSEELTRAIIGCGGISGSHFPMNHARTLAICDPDTNRLNGKGNQHNIPQKDRYTDWREVVARPDIDIVHICTPPHWHGLMALAAAQAGKDIWTEKPFSRTIGEGQAMVAACRRYGTILRINTWFRFRANMYGMNVPAKPIKKLVQAGALGWPLRAVIGGKQGFNWKFGWSGKTKLDTQPVPPHFDYDMWLGPAPFKPYHPHRTHGTFRGYWDYDAGGLGDMGQHYIDPVQYILDKDHDSPIECEIDAPQQHPDACSSWRKITLRYADGCEIILDGENKMDAPFIEGPKGKIWKGFKSDIPNVREFVDSLPDPEPMLTDFKQAVLTRQKFALNEENGHRSCTIQNIAIVGLRLNRSKVRFDPKTQRFIDDDAANALIDQPMRGPWRYEPTGPAAVV